MPSATLSINSRNYGAWSLRGWLMCRFAGLDFDVDEHRCRRTGDSATSCS